jgi:hypothetical protein
VVNDSAASAAAINSVECVILEVLLENRILNFENDRMAVKMLFR